MSKYRLFKLAILFGILLAVFTAFIFAANPGLAATSAPQATEIVDGRVVPVPETAVVAGRVIPVPETAVPQATAVVEGAPGMPVPATEPPSTR